MLSEWPHRKAVETPPVKAEGDRNTSGDHSHQQASVRVSALGAETLTVLWVGEGTGLLLQYGWSQILLKQRI